MHTFLALALFWSFGTLANAIPTTRKPTKVSISAYDHFTQFARAAHCPKYKLQGWACGEACNALKDFEPTLIDGDGIITQTYFVGYWPCENSIVVAHQGTDPTALLPILTDANIILAPLDPILFPGMPSAIRAHAGFILAHARTAVEIRAEVERLMRSKKTDNIVVVGHSLSGALAMLDALFLSLHLQDNAKIKSVTYGNPRVGNAAFARFFETKDKQ